MCPVKRNLVVLTLFVFCINVVVTAGKQGMKNLLVVPYYVAYHGFQVGDKASRIMLASIGLILEDFPCIRIIKILSEKLDDAWVFVL